MKVMFIIFTSGTDTISANVSGRIIKKFRKCKQPKSVKNKPVALKHNFHNYCKVRGKPKLPHNKKRTLSHWIKLKPKFFREALVSLASVQPMPLSPCPHNDFREGVERLSSQGQEMWDNDPLQNMETDRLRHLAMNGEPGTVLDTTKCIIEYSLNSPHLPQRAAETLLCIQSPCCHDHSKYKLSDGKVRVSQEPMTRESLNEPVTHQWTNHTEGCGQGESGSVYQVYTDDFGMDCDDTDRLDNEVRTVEATEGTSLNIPYVSSSKSPVDVAAGDTSYDVDGENDVWIRDDLSEISYANDRSLNGTHDGDRSCVTPSFYYDSEHSGCRNKSSITSRTEESDISDIKNLSSSLVFYGGDSVSNNHFSIKLWRCFII